MRAPVQNLLLIFCLICITGSLTAQYHTVQIQKSKGTFRYPDGTVYQGDLLNNFPEGIGRVNYAGGNWYEGSWKDHAPHGEGVMYFADKGYKVRAIWQMGRLLRRLPLENPSVKPNSGSVAGKPPVRVWALVVGVSQYRHLQSLRYADDDAYQFYSFLKSPAGGALPNQQIRILIDEAATRTKVIEAMQYLSTQVSENDVVFFYFSGHGLEDAFLPSDYDGTDNKLFHREIADLLEKSSAKYKLIIADACHSGGMQSPRSPQGTMIKKFYAAFDESSAGTALLSSSKREEYSLEDSGLRSGIFSYFLRQGIDGQADQNGDKIVTISELYAYIFRNVSSYTSNVQTPVLKGKFDRNAPVAVVK